MFGSLTTLTRLLNNDAIRRRASDPTAKAPPIWITEHGWVFSSNADKPRLQAAYTVRGYALAAAAGIPHEHNSYYYTPRLDMVTTTCGTALPIAAAWPCGCSRNR